MSAFQSRHQQAGCSRNAIAFGIAPILRLADRSPYPSRTANSIPYPNLILTVTCARQGYAWEVTTSEGGWGLDQVLKSRQHVLDGIANGIDMDEWDPATDSFLEQNYSAANLAGDAAFERPSMSSSSNVRDSMQPGISMNDVTWRGVCVQHTLPISETRQVIGAPKIGGGASLQCYVLLG